MKKAMSRFLKTLFPLLLLPVLGIAVFSPFLRKSRSVTCTDSIGCVEIASGEPVRIGVIQSLSGGASFFGWEQVQAIRLAVKKHNSQLLGHPIELQIEDEFCTPEGGINAALKIVTHSDTLAVIGTTCSGSAAATANVVSDAGMVMLSGSNIAPNLTAVQGKKAKDWHPGYFRTIYNGVFIGQMAAEFARTRLGIEKAAVIHDGDAYTRGFADVFVQFFKELGGKVVLSASVNKGDGDMRPVLEAIGMSKAEFVFFILFLPEGQRLLIDLQNFPELADLVLMTGPNLMQTSFIETAGKRGVNLYFANSAWPDNPSAKALFLAYEKAYGVKPESYNYLYSYDAVNMVLHAIEQIAVAGKNGSIHVGRQALRDALYGISGFEGACGRIFCNEFGDCGTAVFQILQLDDPKAGIEGLRANVVYTCSPERAGGSPACSEGAKGK